MQMMYKQPVTLGKPIVAPSLIPVLHRATPACINEPFMADGRPYRMTCLSFSQPYGVVFTEDVEGVNLEEIGPLLEKHPRFPQGASIVFVQVCADYSLKARLWQRNEEEQPYSLEAACAALVAAGMNQKLNDRQADVKMGGRRFHVGWDRATEQVTIVEMAAAAAI